MEQLNAKSTREFAIPDYHPIQQIYESASTQVYRATRNRDHQPVILKILKPDHPRIAEQTRYRQEYEIISHFKIKEAITAYGLETYRNCPVLVLEDFGGVSLHNWRREWNSVAPDTSLISQFISLAEKIAVGLSHIHAAGIIHKNINPSNIVFNPKSGVLKIIDFGAATTLTRETPTISTAQVQMMEGSLAYMSPEQTGRMNRTVDYRTDFYSLGVTFYEMLTGQLPFEITDVMELVHCHMAKKPIAPHVLNPTIPLTLSNLVLKLLAKAPEDRYQSANGLKYDLDLCLKYWQANRDIPDFTLGQHDRINRFAIPEKLYGRATEVKSLLAAFDRVADGGTELMLVTGFSGIGKTAVVNEVYKPIVRQLGYFIKGKFDQFNRNVPFSGFVQALRDLVGQLLLINEDKSQQQNDWQSKILAVLGESGQVIIDVIPELEWLIGTQPSVPELFGDAAQNRFNLLFKNFIGTFAAAEHPLVIFLDDMQWADLASLKLMQLLMNGAHTNYLLLLCAYRDNEVHPAHPLMLTLDEIRKSGEMLNTITLAPLSESDINHLVADTLGCSSPKALPLTKSVYQIARGNPFFNNQFLKSLFEERMVVFNEEGGYWQYDIAQVNALPFTDDVVEFMAVQLQKLPKETLDVLKLAACIGSSFDLERLAVVYQQPQSKTAADLWPALQAGLILPQGEVYTLFQDSLDKEPAPVDADMQIPSYRFLHDRVQQAAYSLIPEMDRPALHLNIGQLLLDKFSGQELDEKLFEIVSHLNAGLFLINDPSKRDAVAQLNLQAGRKAKAATAYPAAMNYLSTGVSLLSSDCWHSSYPLTLSFHNELAEVNYLMNNYDQMKQWIEVVLEKANSLLDKVKVYEIQIQFHVANNQPKEAMNLGLRILEELGTTFPEQPGPAEIGNAFQNVQLALADKPIMDLLNLPSMTDPVSLSTMQLTLSIGAPVYLVTPALFPILIARQAVLSIKHGNTAISAYTYASYGMLLCSVGDITNGYEFGRLALNLLQQLNAKGIHARTSFMFYAFVHHWKSPISETIQPLLHAYHVGLETGDLEFGAYCAAHHLTNAFFCGQELGSLAGEIVTLRMAVGSHHQEIAYNYCSTCLQTVYNLMGRTSDPCSLIGEACDESKMLPQYQETGEISGLHNLIIQKLMLCYIFGNYEQAVEQAEQSEKYVSGVPGVIAVVLHHFYDSLAWLAIYNKSDPEIQAGIVKRVEQNQEKLQHWGGESPRNYQHKYALVEAERCRIMGEPSAAMDWYDQAIAGAKENGYVQEEALANELSARFYLSRGKDKVARAYLHDAHAGYSRWGATAKVSQLEEEYARILVPFHGAQSRQISLTGDRGQSSPVNNSFLDLNTVIKASQAIASEIELERMLKQLMKIVIENAGAQSGALILESTNGWAIEAQGNVENPEITVLKSLDLQASGMVSPEIVSSVIRNHKIIVLDDAASSGEFAHDPYISRNKIRSALCLPLIDQGRLRGILYLENNLTTHTFTAERIELLSLLSTQMALSLDNARLYSRLEAKVTESQRLITELETSNAELEQFNHTLSHELKSPLITIVGFLGFLEQDAIAGQTERLRADIRRIGNATKMMERLINELLEFSQVGSRENLLENIEFEKLVRRALEQVHDRLNGQEILVQVQGELPVVYGNQQHLLKVVQHLVDNAVKFMGNQPKPLIEIGQCGEEDGKPIFFIKDNGMGIPSEYHNLIFGLFNKLDAASDGTGMGLALVKRIVEVHGGRIWVESEVGKGSTFYFSLPNST